MEFIEGASCRDICRLRVTNPRNNRKYSIEFGVVNNDHLTPLLRSKASQHMKLITVNTDQFVCINVTSGLPQSETKSIRDEYADIFDGLDYHLVLKYHLRSLKSI